MFDRQAKVALIALCILLLASAGGFRVAVGALNVYLQKEPVELRSQFANLPLRIGDWASEGDGAAYSAELVEELGTDLYLDRTYVRNKEPEVNLALHLSYYTGMIDAVPHVPDRCFVGAGLRIASPPQNRVLDIDRSRWREDPEHRHAATNEPFPTVMFLDSMTRSPVTVRMPVGDVRLRTTEFSADDAPDRRIFAGYFFVANGRAAGTPEEVKLLAFRKSEKYAYYCKVQLTAVGGRDLTEEVFLERCGSLVSGLLPELMRCLPDWADIQVRTAIEADASES